MFSAFHIFSKELVFMKFSVELEDMKGQLEILFN